MKGHFPAVHQQSGHHKKARLHFSLITFSRLRLSMCVCGSFFFFSHRVLKLAPTFWGREGRGGMKAALKTGQISKKGEKKKEKKKKGNCRGICALSVLQAVVESNVQPPGWEESADLRCHGGSREGEGGIAQVNAAVPRSCPSAISCRNQLGGQISERRLPAPPRGSSEDWHHTAGRRAKFISVLTPSLLPPPPPTSL